mgnify:CR=1 FL=1
MEQRVLRHLWTEGPASRSDLAERYRLRRNDVGRLASDLIERGLIAEGRPTALGPGRPRVPLRLNAETGRVLGVMLEPGIASAGSLDLLGRPIGTPRTDRASQPERLIEAAASLVREAAHSGPHRIGLSVTGLAAHGEHRLLQSSLTPGGHAVSLEPIFHAAGDIPVVMQNDMHALAAQWLLARRIGEHEDVLVVLLRDAAVGAAMIIDGRPNRGCVLGGNEIGHTRLPVDTDRCFCGSRGCLERIFSSAFLRRLDPGANDLAPRIAAFRSADPPLQQIIEHVATALSNAVNFVRPARLVLVGPTMRHAPFADALTRRIREATLDALVDHLRVDRWDESESENTERAGWLALADLYRRGWNHDE